MSSYSQVEMQWGFEQESKSLNKYLSTNEFLLRNLLETSVQVELQNYKSKVKMKYIQLLKWIILIIFRKVKKSLNLWIQKHT